MHLARSTRELVAGREFLFMQFIHNIDKSPQSLAILVVSSRAPIQAMSAIQKVNEDFGFRSDDIKFLASLKYWAIRSEARKSSSYSLIRKHFMKEEGKAREQQKYHDKKRAWADQWYGITAQLLEIGKITPEDQLREELLILNLTEAKKNALAVELATFTPYHSLKEKSDEWQMLEFSEEDRKLYLSYCGDVMNESPYTLWMAWQEFNEAIEKIVRSNSGPNLTWAWVGLGAVALIIIAPYLATAIGGFMGLSGAAATSAGLALLGGGSLATGGLGMTGGYVVLMAGGAILGYGSGNSNYQQKLRQGSKEELLINCGKLYSASTVFNIYREQKLDICKEALNIQNDLDAEADKAYLEGNESDGKQLDAKAMVMRAFRRLLRGDL